MSNAFARTGRTGRTFGPAADVAAAVAGFEAAAITLCAAFMHADAHTQQGILESYLALDLPDPGCLDALSSAAALAYAAAAVIGTDTMSAPQVARTQPLFSPVLWMQEPCFTSNHSERNLSTYTEAPGMPDDERMTDAELRMVREFLGLPLDWLAAHLGVEVLTLRSWEDGHEPIPDGARLAILELEISTARVVTYEIQQLLDASEVEAVTFRSDAEYRAAFPDVFVPASWHRAVVARVSQEVPGLAVTYPPSA